MEQRAQPPRSRTENAFFLSSAARRQRTNMCKGRQKRTNATKFPGFFPLGSRTDACNRFLPRIDGAALTNPHSFLARKRSTCCGVFFCPGEGRLKTRGLSTKSGGVLPKSGGVLPKSPRFLLGCSRVFHRTGIVCFRPCATFFDRSKIFRSTSANFCFDRAYILCIFATIYYHHRTRSQKGHRLP